MKLAWYNTNFLLIFFAYVGSRYMPCSNLKKLVVNYIWKQGNTSISRMPQLVKFIFLAASFPQL
jgi:hypothetical protein